MEYQWRHLANEYYKTFSEEIDEKLANEMSIMLIMFLEGRGGEGGEARGGEGRRGDGTGLGRDGDGTGRWRDGTGRGRDGDGTRGEWWPVERSWRMRSPGNAGSPC